MIIKSVFLKASVRLGRNECILHKHIPVRNTIIYIYICIFVLKNQQDLQPVYPIPDNNIICSNL